MRRRGSPIRSAHSATDKTPSPATLKAPPTRSKDATAFTSRLGAQGPRWHVMGINYYHSTEVTWPSGS